MISICDKKKCTGCSLCVDICNTDAITMEIGTNGFWYPFINKSKCINCGLCARMCPTNVIFDKKVENQRVYASWSRDKRIRKNSASGGMFFILAKKILDEKGVVFGVAWDESFHPRHIMVETEAELLNLQGSKYAQSTTSGIYKKVERVLNSERKVLFSGTPCQIAALKQYLKKPNDNLILVDIVCHGVPSNDALDRYLSEFDDDVSHINFRKKDPWWDYFYVNISFKNKVYKVLNINDPYFNLFNIGFTLRDSCHNCSYANINRLSDITLADFWGYLPKSFAMRDYNRGTSLVITNTKKGNDLFNLIKEDIVFSESDIQTAKNGNRCLSEPFDINEEDLREFWNDYNSGMSISELDIKYSRGLFEKPKHMWFWRLYSKYRWIIKG